MTTQNYYEGVKDVISISSDIGTNCRYCGQRGINVPIGYDAGIDTSIEHYIKEHGYKLLHVGQQTGHDQDGKPWHSTVAIVGK